MNQDLYDSLPDGWLSYEEATVLYEVGAHTAGPFLEVGSFIGKSTVCIAITFHETEDPESRKSSPPAMRRRDRFFGQPLFLQGERFFFHNGELAKPFAVIECGWGDSGNVNLFLALEDGIPVAAFMERSCA